MLFLLPKQTNKKSMTNFFKSILVILTISLFSLSVVAQEVKTADFSCKVEFHCANGQKLLETKLAEVTGITSFVVNLETKVIDFKFNPDVISKDGIVAEIEKIGYYTEFSNKEKEIKKACSHGAEEGHDHNHE